jgi:hypothetical protein
VERAKTKEKAFLERIDAAAEDGDWRLYRHLAFKYLNDDSARLAVLDNRNRKAPHRYRRKLQHLKNLVPEVVVTEPSTHEAVVRVRRKANNKLRHVVRFDLVDKARQEIVRRAYEPWITRYGILAEQHGVTNGGHQEAARAVLEELQNRRELKFAVLADIEDEFNSFDAERVVSMTPIRRGVMGGTVLANAYTYVPGAHSTGTVSLARAVARKLRQGMPQGSAVSPLGAEAVLKVVLAEVDLRGSFNRVSADNIVALARTRAEAEWISQALAAALERSPAGCLRLKTQIRRVADGFTYLGYDYRRRRGEVSVQPSKENFAKFYRRYWFRPIKWRSRGWSLPLRKLDRGIKSWCAAFLLCDQSDMSLWRATWVGSLKHINRCPPDHVSGYARLLDGRDSVHDD